MKEEKRMILSMLEEGKITADEAMELLEALDETEANFTYDRTLEEEYIDKKEAIKKKLEKMQRKLGKMLEKLKALGQTWET